MEKAKKNKVRTLTVGSLVFYPAHGVASVTGKEEREFAGGVKQDFYVLELERGGTLLLPASKVERAGVRDLVSANKARELVKKLKTVPETEIKLDHASRKRRDGLYSEALRSGSADRYTEVLQELLFRLRSDKLSNSEQRTFDVARSYFVGEVGAALELSPEQVEHDFLSVGRL